MSEHSRDFYSIEAVNGEKHIRYNGYVVEYGEPRVVNGRECRYVKMDVDGGSLPLSEVLRDYGSPAVWIASGFADEACRLVGEYADEEIGKVFEGYYDGTPGFFLPAETITSDTPLGDYWGCRRI